MFHVIVLCRYVPDLGHILISFSYAFDGHENDFDSIDLD